MKKETSQRKLHFDIDKHHIFQTNKKYYRHLDDKLSRYDADIVSLSFDMHSAGKPLNKSLVESSDRDYHVMVVSGSSKCNDTKHEFLHALKRNSHFMSCVGTDSQRKISSVSV